MKKIFFFLAFPLLLSGCGTTAKFVYPANSRELTEISTIPVYNKKIAVMPFDDCRNDENQSGTLFLYLIPLSPFGWIEYQRPDAASMFVSIANYEFTPSEDLAKAAAVSLRRSNLFEDAFFTYGGEKAMADFVLEGRIESTYYKGRIFTYGLSLDGPVLWFIGAPAGTSLNRLTLKLTLRNKMKKIIWEYTFNREDYIIQWLYYRMGYDAKLYPRIMQQCMNEAIQDLAKHLKNNPELLQK